VVSFYYFIFYRINNNLRSKKTDVKVKKNNRFIFHYRFGLKWKSIFFYNNRMVATFVNLSLTFVVCEKIWRKKIHFFLDIYPFCLHSIQFYMLLNVMLIALVVETEMNNSKTNDKKHFLIKVLFYKRYYYLKIMVCKFNRNKHIGRKLIQKNADLSHSKFSCVRGFYIGTQLAYLYLMKILVYTIFWNRKLHHIS